MAEAYINFFAGQKIALSAALLRDRKMKYPRTTASDIVALMDEEGVSMEWQRVKTLADISADTLSQVEKILLFDTSMKDDPDVERDFSIGGMSAYHYLKKHHSDKIVDVHVADPYQQGQDFAREVRDIIKDTIKRVLDLPHLNDVTVDVINDPSEIHDREFGIIANVTSNAFGIPMGLQDIKNHIYQNPKVYLSKNNGNIIWFSGVRTYGDFIFRHGTAVHHLFQGLGVYPKMIATISEDLQRSKFFLRTQNNNVIKSYQKLWFKVLLGADALAYMQKHFSEEELDLIIKDAFETDVNSVVQEHGIFRGVYGWLFGKKGNVEHITSTVYPTFDSLHWDSLLVVCVKE